MGNHQCQVAVLVPDKKLGQFDYLKNFSVRSKDVAYHPGPALPPSADGSQLVWIKKYCLDEKY